MFCVTLAMYFTLALYTEIVLLHYIVKEFTFYSNNTQRFVFMSLLFL
jgi:hypothetical protein